MASIFSQTLIRTTATPAFFFSSAKTRAFRRFSTLPESSSYADMTAAEVEAKVVEKIENVIHGIIARRSVPDWLPFVPGASYWVPPRRSSYGVAEVVYNYANALTEEENLSLITLHGWPSSEFYIHGDVDLSSQLDLAGDDVSSINTSFFEE